MTREEVARALTIYTQRYNALCTEERYVGEEGEYDWNLQSEVTAATSDLLLGKIRRKAFALRVLQAWDACVVGIHAAQVAHGRESLPWSPA
jgi:hypothetical protein